MKPTNYFVLAAMASSYLGAFLTGLLDTWTWSLIPWFISMLLVVMAAIELDRDKDTVARAMTVSWFVSGVAGTMAHVSITWSMVMFLPVLVIMAAWAWYIRKGIKKTLISH